MKSNTPRNTNNTTQHHERKL